MDKAIERQRVLLQHLRPSQTSSSLENIESSISVSSFSDFNSVLFFNFNLELWGCSVLFVFDLYFLFLSFDSVLGSAVVLFRVFDSILNSICLIVFIGVFRIEFD